MKFETSPAVELLHAWAEVHKKGMLVALMDAKRRAGVVAHEGNLFASTNRDAADAKHGLDEVAEVSGQTRAQGL